MLSKRIKILATTGLVAVIAGVCAGAGVLIYQSTSQQSSVAASDTASSNTLAVLFPDTKDFKHYPFLNYVRTKELSLGTIADIKKYAADGAKTFAADVNKVGEQVFANALLNAKYWGGWAKYQATPGSYKLTTKVQRVTDTELYLAVGLSDANGLTWYDIGEVSL